MRSKKKVSLASWGALGIELVYTSPPLTLRSFMDPRSGLKGGERSVMGYIKCIRCIRCTANRNKVNEMTWCAPLHMDPQSGLKEGGWCME
jgi:hypothetical protein